MHKMNVLYTFDNKFWRMAAVSINSLLKNCANCANVCVYCMVAPRTRGYKKIKKIVTEYGGTLIWKQIRKSQNPFRNHEFLRWSPVIFYRLFVHRIFPELDKVLYLDSDTLVRSDLTKLYETDISEYSFGAVCDLAPVKVTESVSGQYVKKFIQEYLKHDLYVNSGVLLINVKEVAKYENEMLSAEITLKYPDQDIINYVFDGKILRLPLKYNFVPNVENYTNLISEQEFAAAIKETAIFHFYAIKPYVYSVLSRDFYEMFAIAAQEIGFYPEDFITKQKKQKKYQKTMIPGLYLGKNNSLRFLGIRLV